MEYLNTGSSSIFNSDGMSKVILKILLFLAPMLAGYVLLEMRLSKVPNIYNKKRTDLEAQLADIEVLELGASHAFFDLNPRYLSRRALDLASTFQTEYYDAQLAKMYVNRMPKLKLVLLSADFISFFTQLHDTKEEWRDYYYYQFWGIKYPGLPLLDARKFSKLALYTPGRVLDSLHGCKLSMDLTYTQQANGWAPYKTLTNYAVTDSTGKIEVNRAMKNFSRENVATIAAYMDDLIKYLTARHLQVALISYPVSNTYYDNCPVHVVRLEDSVVANLCATYGCKYFNYTRDSRFTLPDFADNDHIYPAAAARFSKIVDSDIVQKAFQ